MQFASSILWQMNRPGQPRTRILVAGAGGAIGGAVCRDLARDHDVVALVGSSLRAEVAAPDAAIEWRTCEAFSRRDVENALRGCDYVMYLVHTRVATARLDQVACEDTDLLIADNVARASQRLGVKQIIYLTGPLPSATDGARRPVRANEVRDVLGHYSTPVTTLRAGLIVAPGSGMLQLLGRVATRLPVVLVPQWAVTRRRPIAVTDVIRAMRYCLGNEATLGQEFEIGGPVVLDFSELLTRMARILGGAPRIITVPVFPRRLYERYLRLLDRQAHPDLVRRVIEALCRDTNIDDNPVQRHVAAGALQPQEFLEREIGLLDRTLPANPREASRDRYLAEIRARRSVRSIQRAALPRGHDAAWLADHYFDWLARLIRPFMRCETDQHGTRRIVTRLIRLCLLELTLRQQDSSGDCVVYDITDGWLARGQVGGWPRLEFRDVLGGRHTIIAIHDFTPQLPWFVYRATQATIHLGVMRAFQRHMARMAAPGR